MSNMGREDIEEPNIIMLLFQHNERQKLMKMENGVISARVWPVSSWQPSYTDGLRRMNMKFVMTSFICSAYKNNTKKISSHRIKVCTAGAWVEKTNVQLK